MSGEACTPTNNAPAQPQPAEFNPIAELQRAINTNEEIRASFKVLLQRLTVLVDLTIVHAQDELERKRKRNIEDLLRRAFPDGHEKVQGPLREVIEMLVQGK